MTMAERTITPEEQQTCADLDRSAPGPRWQRRPTYDQARVDRLVPRHRVGGRQRGHGHAPGSDERRRERPGQPRAQPPREGARHPSRCAPAEEHGRDRGDSRKGHRQVREAGRRHRLADPGHQSVRHADRHRDLRDQVQGRGDLFAASGQPEDDERNRPAAARRAAEARRAGGSAAVRRTAEHSAVAGPDGGLRSDDRHGRPAHGARRLRLGQARLRRRRRQRDDGHRRDGGHRRSREEHRDQQDERPRVRLFGGRQPRRRGVDLRRAAGASCRRRRLRRQRQEKEQLQESLLGRARPPDRGHDRAGRRRSSPPRPGFRFRPDKTFLIVPEDKIGKAHLFSTEKLGIVLAVFSTPDSTRRSTSSGGFSRPAGAATRAASTRSTTITSTGWR